MNLVFGGEGDTVKCLRGRRKWLAVAAVVLTGVVPLHLADDATRDRALLRGLERRYGDGGERDPVYIEGGPRALAGLSAVGRQPVEVVSRGELAAQYAVKKVAPALTSVTVDEQWGILGIRYSVTASSSGFPVPGATAIPLGGTHIYHFRQWGGMLWSAGEDFNAH